MPAPTLLAGTHASSLPLRPPRITASAHAKGLSSDRNWAILPPGCAVRWPGQPAMTFRLALPVAVSVALMAAGARAEPGNGALVGLPPDPASRQVAESGSPGLLAPGTYLDPSGMPVRFDLEYQRQGEQPKPHHLRSWAQMGLGLGVGAVVYWIMMEQNSPDWDNPRVVQRFDGTAWRLDNNSLPINFIFHPGFGGLAYAMARANHSDVAGAAWYSFLTSFIWEYVFEFKEMVSVNDVIATPAAGVPIGEFLHKLGLYLDSARSPGVVLRTTQWVLGTGVQLDHALDGTTGAAPRFRDSLGLTASIWHDLEGDFEFHSARSVGTDEDAMYRAGLRCRLVTLPGYLRPGHFARTFYRADLASMSARGEVSGRGGGAEVTAETLLFGYHLQAMRGGRVATHGHALTTGASVAYRFIESGANDYGGRIEGLYVPEAGVSHNARRYNEQYSVAHLPGPALDWYALAPGVRLEVGARVHPDFAGVGGLAYSDWAKANPDERGKAILLKQGYFYGWGGSGEFFGRLAVGPLRLAAAVLYGKYRSQDGLERQPEKMTVDVPAGAEVLSYRGSLRVQPPELPLELGVSAEMRRWGSWVGDHHRSTRMLSRGLQISMRF